jgi:hypothetical protein
MIEEFIRQHSGEFTKTQLWKNLPRKVMYQTFCVAFEYLMNSNKIAVWPETNKIVWIWDQTLVKKVLMRREASKFTREVVKVPGGKVSIPSEPRRLGGRL